MLGALMLIIPTGTEGAVAELCSSLMPMTQFRSTLSPNNKKAAKGNTVAVLQNERAPEPACIILCDVTLTDNARQQQ